jgi:hypothetical protein
MKIKLCQILFSYKHYAMLCYKNILQINFNNIDSKYFNLGTVRNTSHYLCLKSWSPILAEGDKIPLSIK